MKNTEIMKCASRAMRSLASSDPRSAVIVAIATPIALYGIDQLRSLFSDVMDKHYKLSFKCPVVEMNLEPADAA